MPYAKGEGPSVVIALGGNALGNSPQEQLELVKNTAKHIVDMVGDGVNVVVSHGNGPQVGMINNAFAYAAANDGKTPEMPFPEAGAMSQGYIGYQLSQAILNDLKSRGIMRSVANVITQTVVNPEDPAFQNPTKPVGAFYDKETAERIAAEQAALAEEQARIQAAEQALAKARTTDASSAMSQLTEVDWSCGKDAFISEWTNRINNYLAGSPLAGQGETFATAAWENGVDPRWSPAISNTESTKGTNCFLPHNAWGWGSTGWSSWEEAINAHVAGLAKGYGYTISYSNAQKYCPPNYDNWFHDTLREMSKI